jgi:small subunit ribosomal protein S18
MERRMGLSTDAIRFITVRVDEHETEPPSRCARATATIAATAAVDSAAATGVASAAAIAAAFAAAAVAIAAASVAAARWWRLPRPRGGDRPRGPASTARWRNSVHSRHAGELGHGRGCDHSRQAAIPPPAQDLPLLSGDKAPKIDMDGCLLGRYVSERGKIVPSRITAVSAKKQRELYKAIKRSRFIGLLPYVIKQGCAGHPAQQCRKVGAGSFRLHRQRRDSSTCGTVSSRSGRGPCLRVLFYSAARGSPLLGTVLEVLLTPLPSMLAGLGWGCCGPLAPLPVLP